MWYVRTLVLTLVFTPSVVFSAPHQLVIDTDEYHYEATFDPNRISEARLRELLPFSPYAGIGDGWKLDDVDLTLGVEETPGRHDKSLLATALELCIADDPRYRPCGARNISDPNFFANARVNVELNARGLAALDRLQVPSELIPILKHYRDALDFFSLLEQRRLEYLSTADLRLLAMPIDILDPSKACAPELKELQSATTLQQRYLVSHRAWHTCVIHEWDRTASPYPSNAWHSFLAAYGITERFSFKSVD